MERPVVLVVDDDQPLCDSLKQLFNSVQLESKAYPDADSFLSQVDTTRPGCILLDLRLPGLNGLELQRQLQSMDIPHPVIFLTAFGDVETAVNAMKSGAFDFLEKPFNPTMLLSRVREGIELSRERQSRRQRKGIIKERIDVLTDRERQVMDSVVSGFSNKEIAETLGLSRKTVEFHRFRLMKKMQAGSLPELVRSVIDVRSVDQ